MAVSLGALQSSSMPGKELNNAMAPPGERDLPPNPACHLTSANRNAPGGQELVSLRLERAKDGRRKARGVDREASSNDLGLWVFPAKSFRCPEKSAQRGATMENETPQAWSGKDCRGASCRCRVELTHWPRTRVTSGSHPHH